MKDFTIYWFSGTGNTLLIARVLKKKLELLGSTAQLVDMAGPVVSRPGTLVFCWPVYSFGMPRLVQNYISQLPRHGNPAALLCTMGGEAQGALKQGRHFLHTHGYKVTGGKAILMPNNYPGGRIPREDSISELMKLAKVQIKGFAQALVEDNLEEISGASLISRLGNKLFLLGLPLSRLGFKVSEACNGCRICYRVCPVENIQMVEERPKWQNKCEQCLRCLHVCPEQAIDFMRSVKRGRPAYIAPGISAKDFLYR